MDYRRFLAKTEALVLPWLGGRDVDAGDRRLRLTGEAPGKPGWYSFEVSGRKATLQGPADPPDLSKRPKVRGWLRGDRLFREGGVIEPVQLLPDEEPPLFSPIVARRWSDGALLFDSLEFESEAEGTLREALAERRALKDVKGVPAPLRAAYGLSVLERVGREKNVRFAPLEVRLSLGPIAEEGAPKAEAVLQALEDERELARRELLELERRRQQQLVAADLEVQRQALRDRQAHEAAQGLGRRNRPQDTVEERAENTLAAAGAQLETLRRLRDGQLEVVFRYRGERFISIVDGATLQVIDSGICLGHPPRDELVTLESLIGVIEEAMDTGALVILRWP
ncbi:MAG: hypothetical protein JNJ54_02395 [Myxococcaceae bacterium]|nr:hypothetical protein [Myxococcaceae bacterium]